MTTAAVPGDAIQPAAQPRRISALGQMPVGAYETLRHRVRRRIGTPEHTDSEAQQARLISPDQNPERLPIAAQDAGDYFDVARGAVVHYPSDPWGGYFVTVRQGFPVQQPETS